MGCGRNNVSESSSMSNSSKNSHSGCVCSVVEAILDIQNQAVQDECRPCLTNCFMEPLGSIVSPVTTNADTRVFMLITKTGAPFMSFFKNTETEEPCTSVFYRVEDVFEDCCATLRVLKPLTSTGCTVDILNNEGTAVDLRTLCDVTAWEATDTCITVDLDCFCAVQCIADVNLGICN